MSNLAQFSVEADPVGIRKFFVNGVDLADRAQAVQVTAYRDQLTVVSVTAQGPGEIQGEGIVNIYHSDTGDALVRILDRLNSKAINEEAMERMGWGDDRSLTQVIIEVIKEQVREAQSHASGEADQRSDGG